MMMGWNNMMYNWGYNHDLYANGNYAWFGLLAMVLQFIFWIAVIIIAVRLFRSYNNRKIHPGSHSNDHALNILRERYARGEINTEEYNQRKQDLEH